MSNINETKAIDTERKWANVSTEDLTRSVSLWFANQVGKQCKKEEGNTYSIVINEEENEKADYYTQAVLYICGLSKRQFALQLKTTERLKKMESSSSKTIVCTRKDFVENLINLIGPHVKEIPTINENLLVSTLDKLEEENKQSEAPVKESKKQAETPTMSTDDKINALCDMINKLNDRVDKLANNALVVQNSPRNALNNWPYWGINWC